jgi:hypothetical protein
MKERKRHSVTLLFHRIISNSTILIARDLMGNMEERVSINKV